VEVVAVEEVATSIGMEIGRLLVILKQEILTMLEFRELSVPLNVLQLLAVLITPGTHWVKAQFKCI